ncbi:ABC transporter ATP-binding protein [uncultured Roseobacter sp.]|uniref:ABC transporter ATP-binding protein n=1 Tax=uncultured Roseobacter sp. TaxID=114847 RepID=UPI0026238D41|nr:ABC transporter ATP-binding protein [uncultured Roseobacter sp.]
MKSKSLSAAARLIAPVRGKIVLACVMQAISTIAGMAPFIAVVEITRVLLEGTSPEQAVTIAWIAAAALAIKLVCMIAAGGITHFADADLQLMIRREVATKLRRVPLSWFASRTAGGLKKAMQDDVAALHELVGRAYTSLTGAIAAPVTALLYLAWTDLLLVPVALIPVGIGIALYALQTRGYGEKMDRYEAALADVNAAAVEYAGGIAVIKTYSGTDRAFSRFTERTERFVDFFWSWISGLLKIAAITDLVLSPLFAVVLAAGFGLMLTTAGTITAVDALALLVMAPALTAPFLTLAFGQQGLMQARRAAERLGELLDARLLDVGEAAQRPTGTEVRLKAVHASYDGAREVLRNINLTLPPGSTTALVGPSGSGKSTLAKLLPRFIDPTEGEITLGGVELPQIAPDHLYNQVGFVFQEVQLLRGSLARNIALGAPDADRAVIETAARAARIHQRIMDLPQGYDTIVGEGAALSGGEAQRITIARALLANRPILVLDEALAFADAETSHALRAALNAWSGARTLLIVAHDLRSVVAADQICVMDHGGIVACGTHHALLEQNALYARLWAANSMEDCS